MLRVILGGRNPAPLPWSFVRRPIKLFALYQPSRPSPTSSPVVTATRGSINSNRFCRASATCATLLPQFFAFSSTLLHLEESFQTPPGSPHSSPPTISRCVDVRPSRHSLSAPILTSTVRRRSTTRQHRREEEIPYRPRFPRSCVIEKNKRDIATPPSHCITAHGKHGTPAQGTRDTTRLHERNEIPILTRPRLEAHLSKTLDQAPRLDRPAQWRAQDTQARL